MHIKAYISKRYTLLCKDAILPTKESGVCERKCTDSVSICSTGVRGKEGGVAVGRGGAGPLRDVVEPIRQITNILD